jgi:hypothetical protein
MHGRQVLPILSPFVVNGTSCQSTVATQCGSVDQDSIRHRAPPIANGVTTSSTLMCVASVCTVHLGAHTRG